MKRTTIKKEQINLMINEFNSGVKDTRKDLFEIYFGVSDKFELDSTSDKESNQSMELIVKFLESISMFINGIGMNDKEYLIAEEKSIINSVNEILKKYNSKEKTNELLKYSQGIVANLDWLKDEEELYYINYLSTPILEFTLKNFIRENF